MVSAFAARSMPRLRGLIVWQRLGVEEHGAYVLLKRRSISPYMRYASLAL
jgi:hypothetical protein